MVSAWLFNDDKSDQRNPHQFSPNQPISLAELAEFGVLYFFIDAARGEAYYQSEIDKFAKARNYKNRDIINIHKDTFPNYDEKIKIFFEEHLHEDEEIRFVLDGSGYFDVRDKKDRWIRIAVKQGDLLILPAGIYHRFTLDTNNYIKPMRLFKEVPKWTPINRDLPDTDANAHRKEYIQQLKSVGKIHTYPNNPRVAKALVAAEFNKVHVEVVEIEVGKTNTSEEYLYKFPTGDIPAFETLDGFYLTGGNAIAQYIASAVPGSKLCGTSTKEAALIQQFMAVVDHELAPAQAAWLFPILGWTPKNPDATKKAIDDTKRVLTLLNTHLRDHTYLVGEDITLADITVSLTLLNFYRMVFDAKFRAAFKNVDRWFLTLVNQPEFVNVIGKVELLGAAAATPVAAKPATPAAAVSPAKKAAPAPAPAKKAADEDEDFDLFADDDEEEDAEKAALVAKRLEEYNAKKALKPKTIAKSMVILDVKPWDDETDMKALEADVRSIAMDGLVWGTSKLVAIGYGIKKLQITAVVEDDKVGVDDLSDQITGFEDYVQSVDVASFNKL
ncbi:1,2-dihydroxy-3-keto-5-methylthiopentene dioxygenase [Rhizoclosmatium sp. JEL0117]|nr:1,2-dihydroxy-3-keto-5-methylthiopentene dioxygenase [Rhizoclosmatium sp. JEL0117]